ncbi:MAG: serine hydrolase domain-containing protein [Acidimicrobiia bacterium]
MHEPANAAITRLLEGQVTAGRQIGVQVSVYRHGVLEVDTRAGCMGPHDSRVVQPDSLFCSFSSTKGVAALAVHMLADRGLLDYDAPVADYWPAFAKHGKGAVTVAQAMSHQTGLYAMPAPFHISHMVDWDAGIRRIEDGVPAWTPGDGTTGYHAVTYSWIAGGIVAAVSGRHIRDFIATEIAAPLGVADEFFVGVPVHDASVRSRLTSLHIVPAGDGLPIPDDHAMFKAMPKALWTYCNDLTFREACLPGANGHFSSRALARMYGALANGGEIDGVRLVSKDRIAAMQAVQAHAPDVVLAAVNRKGIGFFIGGLVPAPGDRMVHGPIGPSEHAFGHTGAGGSVGFADPEHGLGVAVTINKMAYPAPGEGTTIEITDLIRELFT